MRVFDASSIIVAWDTYPIGTFPPLWDWIAEQIGKGEITIPAVAYEQIAHMSPRCHEWLELHDCKVLEVTEVILHTALTIKNALGIVDDNYHPKGVDEPDVIIIATAKIHTVSLVSDESPQTTVPDLPQKLRIPRVCRLPEAAVQCGSFLDYLKDSGVVFG